MTGTNDVTTEQAKAVRESNTTESAIRPAVDIFEDDMGITVVADMPGVSRDRLEVQVDSDSLSIQGEADIVVPEAMDALYADIRTARYQRGFSLSRELDGDNIEAHLQDGVLTLRIPKRAEHKPRKIEVRAG
jgi:HSP20 family molecular chaperone IbpA